MSRAWSRQDSIQTPIAFADVVTTTTHKTLRGPRGGIIMGRANPDIEKKIASAVFPGTQGGPLMHVIAGKAVALLEALQPQFAEYQEQVLRHARAMALVFERRGYQVVSGGTDNHFFLVSLIEKGLTGKAADAALGAACITVNKNAVPHDPQSPLVTGGIRIGTSAITTRVFTELESGELASWIYDVLDDIDKNGRLWMLSATRSRAYACAFPSMHRLSGAVPPVLSAD